ncbi:hypothetical protein EZV62_018700 [Acer yangbiense]|uniref:Uncharacterized protein n=1 Tax=Acer yangbiense TaxID=1000413 RepID=A0A5C7HK44_9ROSI|nr:hypothetical protein EZV62_018700 [Acer yangbiense]
MNQKRCKGQLGLDVGNVGRLVNNSRTCKNTSTNEFAITSTVTSQPRKATKRKRNEIGSSSTHVGPDLTHPRLTSTHVGNATATGLGGSSTIATSHIIQEQ